MSPMARDTRRKWSSSQKPPPAISQNSNSRRAQMFRAASIFAGRSARCVRAPLRRAGEDVLERRALLGLLGAKIEQGLHVDMVEQHSVEFLEGLRNVGDAQLEPKPL